MTFIKFCFLFAAAYAGLLLTLKVLSKFNDEEEEYEFRNDNDHDTEETRKFERTTEPQQVKVNKFNERQLEWDLVQYAERPTLSTSSTHKIELEISETNLHQLK